ncbi:MAG: serine/threonine protein kinase, partial [Verrucomicrobiaceae bacterium]
REALATFRSTPTLSLTETMERTHQALTKTRGAAGAIVELRVAARLVENVGIGNISMRVVSAAKTKNLVSDNGTLGASVRKVQAYTQPWSEDMLLVMHSDGLAAQWSLDDYPGLSSRHPSLIAGVLYRDLKRSRDDATVVAVRYIPRP